MQFLKELLDYEGNRYELTRAVIEYSKKVRRLYSKDADKEDFKETLLAIEHVLKGKVQYTLNKEDIELSEGIAMIEERMHAKESKKKVEDSVFPTNESVDGDWSMDEEAMDTSVEDNSLKKD